MAALFLQHAHAASRRQPGPSLQEVDTAPRCLNKHCFRHFVLQVYISQSFRVLAPVPRCNMKSATVCSFRVAASTGCVTQIDIPDIAYLCTCAVHPSIHPSIHPCMHAYTCRYRPAEPAGSAKSLNPKPPTPLPLRKRLEEVTSEASVEVLLVVSSSAAVQPPAGCLGFMVWGLRVKGA